MFEATVVYVGVETGTLDAGARPRRDPSRTVGVTARLASTATSIGATRDVVAPDLLNKVLVRGDVVGADRRGRGVLRFDRPGQPRVPRARRSATPRCSVRRAGCTCTSPTACTGARTRCAATRARGRGAVASRRAADRHRARCTRHAAPRRVASATCAAGRRSCARRSASTRRSTARTSSPPTAASRSSTTGLPPPSQPGNSRPRRARPPAPSIRGAGSCRGDPNVSQTAVPSHTPAGVWHDAMSLVMANAFERLRCSARRSRALLEELRVLARFAAAPPTPPGRAATDPSRRATPSPRRGPRRRRAPSSASCATMSANCVSARSASVGAVLRRRRRWSTSSSF